MATSDILVRGVGDASPVPPVFEAAVIAAVHIGFQHFVTPYSRPFQRFGRQHCAVRETKQHDTDGFEPREYS